MSVLSEQFRRAKRATPSHLHNSIELHVREGDGNYTAAVVTAGSGSGTGTGRTPEDAVRNAVTRYVSS